MLNKIINKLMLLTFVFFMLSTVRVKSMDNNNLEQKQTKQDFSCDDLLEYCKTDNVEALKLICKNDITLLEKSFNKDMNNIIAEDFKLISNTEKPLNESFTIDQNFYPIDYVFMFESTKIIEFLYTNHLIALKRILRSQNEINCLSAVDSIILSDKIKVIEFLYNKNLPLLKELLNHKDTNGLTPIFTATLNDKVKIIEFFHDKDLPLLKELLNQKCKNGLTPIFTAIVSEKIKIIDFLYDKDLPLLKELLNQKCKNGSNIISMAIANKKVKIIDFLCNKNLPLLKELLNQKNNDQQTPLHFACIYGNLDLVKHLLSITKSNNSTIKDISDNSPFLYACLNGHKNIVEYLLDTYPELNLLKQKSNDNSTAEQIAKKHGNFNIKLLPSYNKKLKDNEFLLHCIKHERLQDAINHIKNKCVQNDLTFEDENGKTPFILACKANQEELIKLILDKGKKINTSIINKKDNYGFTPIIWACMHKNWDLVITLLEYCTPETIETLAEIPDDTKSSCLEIACELNAPVNIIKKLTTPKTINIKNKQSKTPLYYACKNNNKETIKYLLLIGAEITPEIKDFSVERQDTFSTEINNLLSACMQENKEDCLKNISNKLLNTNTNSSTNTNTLEQENNDKLAFKIVVCRSLTENDKPIDENHLCSKIFNNNEINAEKIFEMKQQPKCRYDFIYKIDKDMKLKTDMNRLGALVNICTICIERFSEIDPEIKITTLSCKHHFHPECITKWFMKNEIICPNCKERPILDSKLIEELLEKNKENLTNLRPIDTEMNNKKWQEAIKILTHYKGEIDLMLEQDFNIFNIACKNNQAEIIKLLLKKNNKQEETNTAKTIIKKISTQKNKKKQTPAIKSKKYYIIKIKNEKSTNTQDTRDDAEDTNITKKNGEPTVGWTEPANDDSEIAMIMAKNDPEKGYILNTIMKDSNCSSKNGWKKVVRIFTEINNEELAIPIEIHYVLKTIPKTTINDKDNETDVYEANHFKFKKYSPQIQSGIKNGSIKQVNLNNEN